MDEIISKTSFDINKNKKNRVIEGKEKDARHDRKWKISQKNNR